MTEEMLPRISIFMSDRFSSTTDSNSTEISTPLLPSQKKFKSKNHLKLKRSLFNEKDEDQKETEDKENEEINEDYFSKIEQRPLDPLEIDFSSEFGSSSCGEESPLERKLRRRSPLLKQEWRFNEDLYKTIDDYLDNEGLHICNPEDRYHKRGTFSNLRVSTLKIALAVKSENPSDKTLSELNSPSLISPSIMASSLFQRRSLSRDCMTDSGAKSKLSVKSPFFNNMRKHKDIIETDDEHSQCSPVKSVKEESLNQERSSPSKKSIMLTELNTKLKKLTTKEKEGLAESPNVSPKKNIEFSPVRLLRPL